MSEEMKNNNTPLEPYNMGQDKAGFTPGGAFEAGANVHAAKEAASEIEKSVSHIAETEIDIPPEGEEYSLSDDRRVKVLSPGRMVLQRFLRNRVAVAGLIILIIMFIFSFVGGALTPYGEAQVFYRYDQQSKVYAAVTENADYRFDTKDSSFTSGVQAQMFLAMATNKTEFEYRGDKFTLEKVSDDYAVCMKDGQIIGNAHMDIMNYVTAGGNLGFDFENEAFKAYVTDAKTFTVDGKNYSIDEDGTISEGTNPVAFVNKYIVRPLMSDQFLSREWQEELVESINAGDESFKFVDEGGSEYEYFIEYDARTNSWNINQMKDTRVFDTYAPPSKEHWLGTDKYGMDMLTRLMYGGRISLIIGFVVELIAMVLGIIMGGIAGYFGGWIDMFIMRLCEIFFCVPSTPLLIMLGAAMDTMHVDPTKRMMYLMLILGFLGWAGMAYLIRGQILSLREQEYMAATEATGLSVRRRILQHLVPNVIPQIIVSVTMGIGGVIITESTLSFLGLGVKFPFASWGNIISSINEIFVFVNYWWNWIPAGTLILLTVLAYNLVGDGLRDAFDPRMKR